MPFLLFQEAISFKILSRHGDHGIYKVHSPFMNFVVHFSPLQMHCGVHHRDSLKENDFKVSYILDSVFVRILG